MVKVRKETYIVVLIYLLIGIVLLLIFSIEYCFNLYLINMTFFKESMIILLISAGAIIVALWVYKLQKNDVDRNKLDNEISYINNAICELDFNIGVGNVAAQAELRALVSGEYG